jgi:hypothetical protein
VRNLRLLARTPRTETTIGAIFACCGVGDDRRTT